MSEKCHDLRCIRRHDPETLSIRSWCGRFLPATSRAHGGVDTAILRAQQGEALCPRCAMAVVDSLKARIPLASGGPVLTVVTPAEGAITGAPIELRSLRVEGVVGMPTFRSVDGLGTCPQDSQGSPQEGPNERQG